MRYYTAREAADATGLSERTIRRHIEAGQLKARKVGARRYQIAEIDLPARKVSELEELRAEVARLTELVAQLQRMGSLRAPVVAREAVAIVPIGAISNMARYLERHGVNYNTARAWAGLPLDEADALRFALQKRADGGWRSKAWDVHECEVAGCACHQVLA